MVLLLGLKTYPKKETVKKGTEDSCPTPASTKISAEDQGKRAATSLILFEEVDIIFDDDTGFLAAIKTFNATTKRPVILTTSGKCSWYKRQNKFIKMNLL